MRPLILNVAEKPSVAKEAALILSQNRYSSIRSDSQYNPIYEFDIQFRNQPAKMHFTSVTGHIMNFEFPPQYKEWRSVDPKVLLQDAPVNRAVSPDKVKLASNLRRLSQQANILVLWLDCDAEGEAIAFEVIEICQQTNRNLSIQRAHFSAVTRQDITQAFNNLKSPNKRLSDSIEARQEIDLRIGASFTRFQTLTLQPRFSSLASNLISYGPCQMPTLGFVVERYKKVKGFVAESFWYIYCKFVNTNSQNQREIVEFSWARNRLFDEYCAQVLFEKCLENPLAKVLNVDTHVKSKWRPLPLNTIELQKLAVRKLHISSSKLMEIAEKLYTKGVISYPRTETDSFVKTINLQDLIGYHCNSPEWGNFANSLLNNQGFTWPRHGNHNDNAHPPIHPVKLVQRSELTMEEWKVYELISRHFLACCSQDAKGQERVIEIAINEERFIARGMVITNYNYLEVYIYEKWVETSLPDLKPSQNFTPTELSLKEGRTTAPNLLTEAELIATMDRNGIGTDATIAEHIKTIQERGYAEKIQGTFFNPTSLGLALVESYENMGIELAKPKLRAEMEKNMKEIVQGRKNKEQVVRESVQAMLQVYLQINAQKQVFIENVRRFYREEGNLANNGNRMSFEDESNENPDVDLGNCRVCQQKLVLFTTQYSKSLKCRRCETLLQVPRQSELSKMNFSCPLCQSQILSVKSLNNNSNYYLCPYCYNNPINGNDFGSTMPCFKCPHETCQYAGGRLNKRVFSCEKCKAAVLLRKSKKNKFFCGCSNYPMCKVSAFLPDCVQECIIVEETCVKCRNRGVHSNLAQITFCSERQMLPISLQTFLHLETNPLFCLMPLCNNYLEELGYKFSRMIDDSEPKLPANNVNKNNFTSQNINNNLNKTIENQHNNTNSIVNTLKRYEVTNRDREIYGNLNELPADMRCYKCKQPGHLANNCPNGNSFYSNNGNNNGASINNNRNINNNFNRNNKNNSNNINNVTNNPLSSNNFNGNNDNNSIKCYKCGQPGHYASTCIGGNNQNQKKNAQFPTNTYQNSNNFNGFNNNNTNTYTNNNNNNSDLSNIKCYKCNQMGHYANKCTNNNNNNKEKTNKNNNNYNNIENGDFYLNDIENAPPNKRVYQASKKKNPCKVCGVLRHSKDSNCIAMKKNKRFKDFSEDFE